MASKGEFKSAYDIGYEEAVELSVKWLNVHFKCTDSMKARIISQYKQAMEKPQQQ